MTVKTQMDAAELEVLVKMREAENGNNKDSDIAEKW